MISLGAQINANQKLLRSVFTSIGICQIMKTISRNTVFSFNQLLHDWEFIHISTIIDVYGIEHYWFMRIKVSLHQS